MRIEIAKLHRDLKTTIVYVTHDQIEAMTMASRIVVLNAGVIEQVGAPLELYHHPTNRFVAGFIGSPKMNFLQARLVSAEARRAKVALRDGTEATVAVDATRAAKDSEVTLGIRPEHLVIVGTGAAGSAAAAAAAAVDDVSSVRGKVVLVENLGESALIYANVVDADDLTLCRIDGTSLLKEGESISLGIPARVSHLFDAEGRAFPRTVDAEPGVERRAS
jgi:multiple sugar transport system ATP-binding protein